MTSSLAGLALMLFQIGAIRLGEFDLKLHNARPDAPKSPVFLNLRTPDHPTKPGPLTPKVLEMIGKELNWLFMSNVDKLRHEYLAGVPHGGIPIVEAFAAQRADPPQRLQFEKLDLGEGQRKVGPLITPGTVSGSQILLIDEMLTEGDSKLETIESIQEAGHYVTDIIVIVDREQGGSKMLKEKGYVVWSLFTLAELIKFYADQGLITGEQEGRVLDYLHPKVATV